MDQARLGCDISLIQTGFELTRSGPQDRVHILTARQKRRKHSVWVANTKDVMQTSLVKCRSIQLLPNVVMHTFTKTPTVAMLCFYLLRIDHISVMSQ